MPNVKGIMMELIYEYFMELERQGPGSPESTIKALNFIDNISSDLKIADLGCGTGGRTAVLAKNMREIKPLMILLQIISMRRNCIQNINSIMGMFFILGKEYNKNYGGFYEKELFCGSFNPYVVELAFLCNNESQPKKFI